MNTTVPDVTGAHTHHTSIYRRARHMVSKRIGFVWSATDQALLSLSSLLLTLVLANALDVKSFGRFSIAWSFLILLEAVLFRGLFDDGLPAVAHRLPKARWPQLRSSLHLASMMSSGAVGLAVVGAGFIALLLGHDYAALMIATGLAIPANRLQSVFRRISYLDGRLPRVAAGAVMFAAVLAVSSLAMIQTQSTSAAAAMFCVALSAGAAGAFGVLYDAHMARPRRRTVAWTISKLLRSGRWFVATSFTYWISSIGLIPICGMLIGLEASASFRILLVAFAPLSQLNASMLSVKLPSAAQTLRSHDRSMFLSATKSNALLFGGVSALYGIVVTAAALPLLHLILKDRGFDLSEANLLLMGLAMALDGIWLGLALPLFAVGKPQQFLSSRVAGLVVLCLSLPIASYVLGVAGFIGAMILSSVASVVVLTFSLRRLFASFTQGEKHSNRGLSS